MNLKQASSLTALAGTLCAPALAAPADSQDRSSLLAGVTEITAPGAIPGDLSVFSDAAFVVMTGKSGKSRLPVIAAARYGQGRAVAVGHEGFFNEGSLTNPDNARLSLNLAGWVGSKDLAGMRIGLVDQDRKLQEALSAAGCKVSMLSPGDLPAALDGLDEIWLNQASLDGAANRSRVTAVRNWVKRGAGVVISGPGWGWQMIHENLDLVRDHSGSLLLRPMGIAFSAAMLDGTGKRGFTTESEVSPLADAQQALAALEDHAAGRKILGPADLDQVTTTLSQAMGSVPDTADFALQVQKLCADRGGDVVPSHKTPITTAMPFARLKAVLDLQRLRRLPPEKVTAHPASVSFPGPVPADAARETRILSIDTSVPAWHGTGLYAAPGEVVTVTLPASAAKKGLAIRIGSQTDTLWHLPSWERFPEITMRRPLNAATTQIASAFGGTLFVDVPENCPLGAVHVTISNAVAAPRFVLGVTDPVEWKRSIRNAPAPWAELEGKLVILSVPSTSVRDLEDPKALMTYWDEVMTRCYELFAAPRRARPERYCVDRQISAGYMHSGYPVMTFEDVAKTFCNVQQLRAHVGIRVWGFYHEMGHNFQKPEWTWNGFGEVTNNLFSLYGTEKINGVTVGAHPAMTASEMDKRVSTVAASPGKEAYYLKDPWFPLTMFYLLHQAFGWEAFTKLFAEFRDLPESEKPRSDAEKRDQFLVRFSKLTGHNLADYLSAWGVALSDKAKAEVAGLPGWMPPDWPK